MDQSPTVVQFDAHHLLRLPNDPNGWDAFPAFSGDEGITGHVYVTLPPSMVDDLGYHPSVTVRIISVWSKNNENSEPTVEPTVVDTRDLCTRVPLLADGASYVADGTDGTTWQFPFNFRVEFPCETYYGLHFSMRYYLAVHVVCTAGRLTMIWPQTNHEFRVGLLSEPAENAENAVNDAVFGAGGEVGPIYDFGNIVTNGIVLSAAFARNVSDDDDDDDEDLQEYFRLEVHLDSDLFVIQESVSGSIYGFLHEGHASITGVHVNLLEIVDIRGRCLHSTKVLSRSYSIESLKLPGDRHGLNGGQLSMCPLNLELRPYLVNRSFALPEYEFVLRHELSLEILGQSRSYEWCDGPIDPDEDTSGFIQIEDQWYWVQTNHLSETSDPLPITLCRSHFVAP